MGIAADLHGRAFGHPSMSLTQLKAVLNDDNYDGRLMTTEMAGLV